MKMRLHVIVFYIVLFVYPTHAFSQNIDLLLRNYIENIEHEDHSADFNVYILYIYDRSITDSSEQYVFTLDYIKNSWDYEKLHYDISWFIEINGTPILVKSNCISSSNARALNFKKLNENFLVKTIQRLYPPIPLSGFTYRTISANGYINITFDGKVYAGEGYTEKSKTNNGFKSIWQ